MIYLYRESDGAFAACEDDQHATRYETRGFDRCSLDEFRAAWRLRDEIALADMWPDALLAREVGTLPQDY